MRARRRSSVVLALLGAVLLAAAGARPAAAEDVRVFDTSGPRPVPCPPVDVSNPREPRGGCGTDVVPEGTEIVVRSVIGDMLFGTCSYGLDMLVDASGRTHVVNIAVGGPNPCNDMNACYHEDIRPWRGQIEAGPDGRLTHVIQACFDTCMGQFVGELRLGLERDGDGWRQTADQAQVGDTGYQLDGYWRVTEGDIDIRPDGSAGGETAGVWRLTGEPVGWPI